MEESWTCGFLVPIPTKVGLGQDLRISIFVKYANYPDTMIIQM